MSLVTDLETEIKKVAPKYESINKEDSKLMRFIAKLMFFNKKYMDSFITTIGQKIYWPSDDRNFDTLAHEFVHIVDYLQKPIRFILGYAFPQILALPGILFLLTLPIWLLLMVFSVISPWWLLILVSLLFLLPIPAPFRKKSEIRGYGMSCRVRMWRYGFIDTYTFDHYVRSFTSSTYYYMWPFEKKIRKELQQYTFKENPDFLKDTCKIVYSVLQKNNCLK